jgi:16S rRNA (cytosine967-C5)-methyltransferase
MKKRNTRADAASVLSDLLSQHGSLTSQLDQFSKYEDFPLLQEICFGVCRHYFVLQSILTPLLAKPLRAKDRDIQCLLLVGVYQLRNMRVPDHAAVNETVAATRFLKKPWAKGLVNAVLRKVLALPEVSQTSDELPGEEVTYNHPSWLIDQIRADWPDQWQHILTNNNQRSPMTLRVNLARSTREAYIETLRGNGIAVTPGRLAASAVYLEQPCPVLELPGFSEGEVSVQDEASQLVPGLLNLSPGLKVLDACAAPGGKTTHILESERSLKSVLAIDISQRRLASLHQNLQRLNLEAEIKVADADQPQQWWDGECFDRILLDAPCSATGVIRRHPDIKLLRRQSDIDEYNNQQLQLLLNLWPCLRTGGYLLYTTCSLLKQENDFTVGAFLDQQQDAKYQAITADWGVECSYGRQLLPDKDGSDGFYFSLLKK